MKKVYNNNQNKIVDAALQSMKRPSGGFISTLTIEKTLEIFNKNISNVIILEEAAGQQLFFVERNAKMILTFYHFSPGTGTREASVDINKIVSCPALMLVLSWSTLKIGFLVTPADRKGGGFNITGKDSNKILRVGTNGKIYHLGNNKQRSMVHLAVDGKLVVQPTAIEVWEETILALDALNSGKSSDKGQYEVAISNMSIVMLVTGFESYTKKRFLEIEDEGMSPNENKLIKKFYTAWQRKYDYIQKKNDEANEKSISLSQLMVLDKSISFQEFNKCKQAFNLAYNIQFYHLGMKDSLLEELKIFFNYRHRIIHVHPAAGILNPDKAGQVKPVHSNKELVNQAKTLFDEFIKKLHNKTLELLPK